MLKKSLVFLPIDWDINGLQLTKRLHMMNKVNEYSKQNHYEEYSALWYTPSKCLYISLEKFN